MKNKKIIISLVLIVLILFGITMCGNYYFPQEDMDVRIKKNQNVEKVEIERYGMDITDKYNIKVITKDGYKVLLHYVKWSLKNKEISITSINDIYCYGGKVFEINDSKKIFCTPSKIVFLGKLINKDLRNVDDVINNIDELYNLFKFLEQNNGKELFLSNKYIVNAYFESSQK